MNLALKGKALPVLALAQSLVFLFQKTQSCPCPQHIAINGSAGYVFLIVGGLLVYFFFDQFHTAIVGHQLAAKHQLSKPLA